MEINKIAVIGGGISGLSIAHLLGDKYKVSVYEREARPGGLIKCDVIQGNLYHMVGGHVFNSRRQDVLEWFWRFFDKESEFTKSIRNSIISMENGTLVGYPIENHAYMMEDSMRKKFIEDLLLIAKNRDYDSINFEEFLRKRFGDTLYTEYFQPYNEKIWRRSLDKVPLFWLEGKLPMPSVEEIIYNNFVHVRESKMVHSTFYYPRLNGSQFLADRLAEGLNIKYNANIDKIRRKGKCWIVDNEVFDKVIFCGNIKEFPSIFSNSLDLSSFEEDIEELDFHGTTSVFCEIESNPYSWIYMPSRLHSSHRIICTGNFSPLNNSTEKNTASLEFTDYISKEDIDRDLTKIPFSPKYITHTYTKYTYPIQSIHTRKMVGSLKKELFGNNIFLLGRFAEWEYYNMDAAIGAAIDLSKIITADLPTE